MLCKICWKLIYCQKCSIMIIIILYKVHKHQVPFWIKSQYQTSKCKSRPVKKRQFGYFDKRECKITHIVIVWKKCVMMINYCQQKNTEMWTTLNYNNLLSLRMHKILYLLTFHSLSLSLFYDWEMFPFF